MKACLKIPVTGALLALPLAVCAFGQSTRPQDSPAKDPPSISGLRAEADRVIANAKATDPTLDPFFTNSRGYVVFPKVGKGGFIFGGAFGKGLLYENGVPTAYVEMTQGTVGGQIGGQKFSELIFFETNDALQKFKTSEWAMTAQATAVALESGRAKNAKYTEGVAVFTLAPKGLMAEAVVGGQKFKIRSIIESSAPSAAADVCPPDLRARADNTIADAKAMDSWLKQYFSSSAGYVVFPTVGKGGLVAGAAYGKGILYEKGVPKACVTLTQGTVGAQAGGQEYSELIFFDSQQSVDKFKAGNYTLDAQASAVAIKSGAAANASYRHGVAIFTLAPKGLMAEAAVGGQKFNVLPLNTEAAR